MAFVTDRGGLFSGWYCVILQLINQCFQWTQQPRNRVKSQISQSLSMKGAFISVPFLCNSLGYHFHGRVFSQWIKRGGSDLRLLMKGESFVHLSGFVNRLRSLTVRTTHVPTEVRFRKFQLLFIFSFKTTPPSTQRPTSCPHRQHGCHPHGHAPAAAGADALHRECFTSPAGTPHHYHTTAPQAARRLVYNSSLGNPYSPPFFFSICPQTAFSNFPPTPHIVLTLCNRRIIELTTQNRSPRGNQWRPRQKTPWELKTESIITPLLFLQNQPSSGRPAH